MQNWWLRIRRISTMVIYRSQPSPYEGFYIPPFSTAPQELRGGADFLLRALDDLCVCDVALCGIPNLLLMVQLLEMRMR